MDPRAAVQRFVEAVTDEEFDDAANAAHELAEWLDDGGFTPTLPREEYVALWAAIAELAGYTADYAADTEVEGGGW